MIDCCCYFCHEQINTESSYNGTYPYMTVRGSFIHHGEKLPIGSIVHRSCLYEWMHPDAPKKDRGWLKEYENL